MGDPITEFLEMDKQAGTFGDFAIRAAATGATIGAGLLANEAYDAVKSSVSRSRGFKHMLDYNPALKKQDRKKVHAIYNTLHNVSPDLAKDPLVANSWVKRMMYQDEYVDPKTMSDLATAQSRMGFGRKAPDFAGMVSQIGAADVFAPIPGAYDKERLDLQRQQVATQKQYGGLQHDLQKQRFDWEKNKPVPGRQPINIHNYPNTSRGRRSAKKKGQTT